ncbi:YihY/virulence factor BrkB family protein [Rubellicoccus peritrichatus]|uniref:YhjD/YihY/BrkB family envelope integrity protein n=1 Tax=Rubellicoccus peritrichatus TaxID=3080537 RepID=A0AAQ3L8J7_9BACT|nr:YhjD/YihY/BrkB family envelope integrity protein [Puniceicoccus sp. CR14]WOO41076.1 YhjD/YihY/BrkB family envelope integrity protein [Puniceicoccus sp. CR14]
MGDATQSAKKSLITQARDAASAIPHLIGKEIWHTKNLEERGLKASVFGLLRIVTITYEGINKNRIPSQAAALSYYTLIALGPLIAIIIMVSGFVVKENQEQVTTDALTKLVYFIAPSAEQASNMELDDFFDDLDSSSTLNTVPGDPEVEKVDPQIVEFIQGVVDNTRSGAVGVIGTLILIVICIQLLSTIEKTFNTIWGVRLSRSLAQQVIFYWTFISLGAVVSFTALTLGVGTTIAKGVEQLPFFGEMFRDWFIALAPVFVFLLIILLLTFFNRFIPNTRVRWVPAALGAVIVAILLGLNKSLSFLYIGFVIRQQSLFGAVGILPILLFGLFVFWVVLLLGGQLTYAIQNVNTLTNQRAWENVSIRTREALSLTALLLISRRFQHCGSPYSADELSGKIRVPGNILNETLTRLCDLGYLIPVEARNASKEDDSRYQPCIPLEAITLAEFKNRLETFGNNDGGELIQSIDPILPYYNQHLLNYEDDTDANIPLSELLKQVEKKQ